MFYFDYSFWSIICAVMQSYCNGTTPTLSNANTPTPMDTVGNSTYYTCNFGYKTNGALQPYYTCLAWSNTSGNWTAGNIYSCVGVCGLQLLNQLRTLCHEAASRRL